MAHNDLQPRTVAVCVLGMHRSGTSALTRLINLLGVYLGDDLIPTSIDNPKGFWEHRAILAAHEQLLDALGSSFDDVLSLPAGWNLSPEVKPFRDKLIEIIRGQFIPYGTLWGFKDPRVCRLLPMWQEIFDTVGADARYILAIRNPEEIARSLAVRDGYSLNKSLLMALTHLLEAEAGTRGKPRVVVSYKSLMEDWEGVSKKIGEALALKWPRSPKKIAPQVAEFLDPDLRHHAVQTPLLSSSVLASADPQILRWTARLQEMFLAAEDDPGRIDSALVDEIRREFEAERPRLDAWKAQRSLGRQNMILEQWGRNLDRTRREMREDNNWLKLALARLGLDPPQVLAAIKAEASAYPRRVALPADLAAASGSIAEMKAELQRRQATVDRLNSELDTLRSWTTELEQAKTWLVREQAVIKQEIDLRDQHIHEMRNWTQELDSGRRWQVDQIEAFKVELVRREKQIGLLQQGFKEQETGKTWLAAQCDQFKAENERLRKWSEELETGREWLESERSKLAAMLAQTQTSAGDSQAQIKKLAEQIVERDATIKSLEVWTSKLNQSQQWSTEQIAGAQNEIANRDKTIDELKAWIIELEQAKTWLVQQRESLQAEIQRRDEGTEEKSKPDAVPSEPEPTGS